MLVYYSGTGYWINHEEVPKNERYKNVPTRISYQEQRNGLFILPKKNELDIKYKKETYATSLLPCYSESEGVRLDGYSEQDNILFIIDAPTPSTNNSAEPFKGIKFTEKDVISEKLNPDHINEKSRNTYLYIIAALLDFIKGEIPEIHKHQDFDGITKFVDVIAKHYKGYPGMSDRNIWKKIDEMEEALKKIP